LEECNGCLSVCPNINGIKLYSPHVYTRFTKLNQKGIRYSSVKELPFHPPTFYKYMKMCMSIKWWMGFNSLHYYLLPAFTYFNKKSFGSLCWFSQVETRKRCLAGSGLKFNPFISFWLSCNLFCKLYCILPKAFSLLFNLMEISTNTILFCYIHTLYKHVFFNLMMNNWSTWC
jgi:hypothetical protein